MRDCQVRGLWAMKEFETFCLPTHVLGSGSVLENG